MASNSDAHEAQSPTNGETKSNPDETHASTGAGSGSGEDRFRCYNCAKPGHMARDCPQPPRNPRYLDTRGTRVDDRGRPPRDSRARDRFEGRRSPGRDNFTRAPIEYPPARTPRDASPRRVYPPTYPPARDFEPRYDTYGRDPRYGDPRGAPMYDRRPMAAPGPGYDRPYGYGPSYGGGGYGPDPRYDPRYGDPRADPRGDPRVASYYGRAPPEWDGRSSGGAWPRGGEYPPYGSGRRRRSPIDRRRSPAPVRTVSGTTSATDYRPAHSHSHSHSSHTGGGSGNGTYPPASTHSGGVSGSSYGSGAASASDTHHRRQ